MLDRPEVAVEEEGWLSTRLLRSSMLFLASRGHDPMVWLQAAGIDPQWMQDLDGRVPLPAVERLLAIVQGELAVHSLGLELARSVTAASFGVLGHLFMAAGTLGELMATIVRYNGLMSSFGWTSLDHGPGTVTLSWRALRGGPALQKLGAEFVLSSCHEMAKVLAPRLPPALVVRFRDDGGGNAALHAELTRHFGCPVHLGQADNAIVMPASWLNIRLPHGDAELGPLLHQRAQALLESRSQRPCVVAQALRHIEQVMVRGAPPSRGIVARRMGYSESTLHRRLQAQGASFQGLVDVQRLNHARQSLANGEASVSMLSQRLGFSSPQVFSRWFRQQTGFSPGQYREKTVAVPG